MSGILCAEATITLEQTATNTMAKGLEPLARWHFPLFGVIAQDKKTEVSSRAHWSENDLSCATHLS
ncbi:MAG: hypothetical protein CR217_09375 [Beijerinckiaceae bacterium]|nr:MAG: hypothetical protein CR217_09375 [Beijerinckiaceae bacterium]